MQAGVYGYPESRSSWWRSMATVVLGREPSERQERSMDALNRWVLLGCWARTVTAPCLPWVLHQKQWIGTCLPSGILEINFSCWAM